MVVFRFLSFSRTHHLHTRSFSLLRTAGRTDPKTKLKNSIISPRTDPNNRHFRASQNCNFYMNFWISSSQTPRSRRALEDLTQNFEENTIFRGQKFGRKSKLSWFFILFPLLHPFFFSRTSVEFYEISMRPGTPPQRGALMAALTRRFNHFCRNEYGFIEAESDQISPTSTRKRSKFW